MTPDLERLRRVVTQLPNIEYLELELVADPSWSEPSDTSYLNERDRANADIMSNVEAMEATNKLISWFGRDTEGFVGLWRGPHGTAIDLAPVVRLDTEGQYSLVAATIADYIAVSVDDDSFIDTREALASAGFNVSQSREAIWSAIDKFESPNRHRSALYNEARVRRGLDPV